MLQPDKSRNIDMPNYLNPPTLNEAYKLFKDRLAQRQAEQQPISEPDQRTVERIQNIKIAELEDRITALEAKLSQGLNYNINVPAFPYRVVGSRLRWHRGEWQTAPFKQADLLDEPEPEWPERDGKGDPECRNNP